MAIHNQQTIKLVNDILKRRKDNRSFHISEESNLIEELNFESLEVAELLIGLEELVGHELNPFNAVGHLTKVSDFTNLANS